MKNHQGHRFHGILMLLCCLAPIVLITALPALKIQGSGINNGLSFIFLLACPLGHLLMMKFMPHKHQDTTENKAELPSVPETDAVN